MNTTKTNSNPKSRKKRASPGRGGSAAKKKGRLAAQDGSSSSSSGPYLPTSLRPGVEDAGNDEKKQQQHRLELQRLLYAMEQTTTSSSSENNYTAGALQHRADLLQALWDQVRPTLVAAQASKTDVSSNNEQDVAKLEQRVVAARQAALQQAQALQGAAAAASALETANRHADAVVRRVFVAPNSAAAADVSLSSSEPQDDEDEEEEQVVPTPTAQRTSTRSATTTTANAVQDLQKAQREQVQDAIHQMAAQLKDQTARIHTTLQSQNENLEDLQDAAEQNVDQVTQVAKDVQEHVSAGWSRTAATWTVFFTICGAFLFGLMTIQLVPKRAGACLFFCPKTKNANEFCRVLPSGKKECIAVPEQQLQQQDDDVDDEEDNFGEGGYDQDYGDNVATNADADADEYNVGMQGDAVPPPQYEIQIPSDEEMRQKVLDEVEETRSGTAGKQDDEEMPYIPPELVEKMPAMRPSAAPSSGEEQESFPGIFNEESMEHQEEQKLLQQQQMQQADAGATNGNGNTPPVPTYGGRPFSATDIRRAATAGDVVTLSSMLAIQPAWINAQDGNGWTALHLATRKGLTNVVMFLLQQKAIDATVPTNSGRTALDIAQERLGSDHEVTQLLLQQQQQQQQEKETEQPLQNFSEEDVAEAVARGNLDLLDWILQRHPTWVDFQDENGWAAIHLAGRAGNLPLVEYLVHRAGCNLALETKAGLTALNLAYERLGPEHAVTKLLVEKHPLPLYQGRPFTSSNVQAAAQSGNVAMLSEMLAIKPDWVDEGDKNRWAALHLGARAGHVEVVQLLIDLGCNVNLQTVSGDTALQIAKRALGEDHAVVELLAPLTTV